MKNKIATVTVVVLMAGLWGCGARTVLPDSSGRIQSLETRIAKLEEDLKALDGAREAAKKTATEFEGKYRQTTARIAELEKERDELKLTLKTRTGERDAVYAQYEGFRKGLKEMLGQADTAAAQFKLSTPIVTVIPAPTIPVLQHPQTVPVVIPSVLPAPKDL